jgi:hypothetical protein
VQEIARHCVERLLKQVDMLCTTYQISNPMVNVSSALSKDFRQLEAVLDQGFLRLAGVLQSGATLPQATVVPSIEQGVEMDGSELGDLEQLLDAPRPGGPATFTLEQTLQLFALACENPADSRRPISHWTPRELADEMVKRGWVESISPRHVGRLLAEADLKPHQVQYWLNPPRPRL